MNTPGLIKLSRTGILLIFFTFFFSRHLVAQEFDTSITSEHLTIEARSVEGFVTWFPESPKDTEKRWWQYTREFGRPLNMKTYYKVTIPASENQGNVDIELLSKTIASRDGCKFFLTVNDANLPADKKQAYLEQTRNLLKHFKMQYYLDKLEVELRKAEESAEELSKEVEKSGNEATVKRLMAAQQEISAIKEKVKEIYFMWN